MTLSGTRKNCQRRTKRAVQIVKLKPRLCLFGDNIEIHRCSLKMKRSSCQGSLHCDLRHLLGVTSLFPAQASLLPPAVGPQPHPDLWKELMQEMGLGWDFTWWEPEGKGQIGGGMKFKGQGYGGPKAKGCGLPDVLRRLAARQGRPGVREKSEGSDSVVGGPDLYSLLSVP